MDSMTCPLEGKIVLLSYTEADHNNEATVVLIYEVREAGLVPVYGVLDLPSEISGWDYPGHYNDDIVLELLKQRQVAEVVTPTSGQSFLGFELGHFDISEECNENDEIECWGEFTGVCSGDFTDKLTANQIIVHFVDPETLKIWEV